VLGVFPQFVFTTDIETTLCQHLKC